MTRRTHLAATERSLARFEGAAGMLAFVIAAFLVAYIALEWIA